jgi:signal transduction histidine kinase
MDTGGQVPDEAYSFLADRDGSVWVGAGNGHVWQWKEEAWRRFDLNDGLPMASFVSMSKGPDGRLWLATATHGLYCSQGKNFVSAAKAGVMTDANVRVVKVDRDESVWVGTGSGGLKRICRRALRYWNAEDGLSKNAIVSVAEDASGAWWAGAGASGMFRYDAGRFKRVEDPGVSAKTHHLYCVMAAKDGSIWGAGEQCVYHFVGAQPAKAYLDAPIRGEAIRAVCVDGAGLWMGTYYSTLLKCDEKGVRTVAPRGSFHGDITSIVQESGDILWIGSSGGLHRWKQGKIRRWGEEDGMLSHSVQALYRDADGTLWIGTLGGGLSRMKDGHFVNFTTRNGLIDDVISQVVADDSECLWLGCNRGIMRLERRELDALANGNLYELHPVIFGKNQGLETEQCAAGHSPTAIKTRDGKLLFPMVSGIAEIDPRRQQSPTKSRPEACIEEVLVDGAPHFFGGDLVVPPGHHRLELHYTAAALLGGEWQRFRYRLDGLESEWVVGSRERLASYDGLAPGHYVFRLVASDAKGEWEAKGTHMSITMQPFLWQTVWFQSGVMALLIGAGSGAAWWQARRKHGQEIQAINEARRQQEELAHFSRASTLGQLTAALAHELNQPLTAILSNAQAARRFLKGGNADLKEILLILDDIVRDDKRAGDVIQNLRAMLGKAPVVRKLHSINRIVCDSFELVKGELAENGIMLRHRLDDDLPQIEAAGVEIEQVLVNLLLNAAHAMQTMPPGRRIIEVNTEGRENGVLVSVIDYGTGITADKLASLFEPFFTTKLSGMGMGLTICRRIIEAHGGRIEARTHEVGGAIFTFFLPGAENRSPD